MMEDAYASMYQVDEIYKGKHGQSEKEYQDGRSDAGKMISGDAKGSGANYSYKAKNTGTNPAGGSERPQGQARMGKKDRDYLAHRKAMMKKEEASDIQYPTGEKKKFTKDKSDPKVAAGRKAAKEMGILRNEEVITEGEKDACYHKVKSRYKVWPSAYASGALVKCRKKGAKNWGNSTKKEDLEMVFAFLINEGFASTEDDALAMLDSMR